MKFSEGERVRLPAVEDAPEEFGVVEEIEDDDMYIVRVDKQYRDAEDDDGIREVHIDAMRKVG